MDTAPTTAGGARLNTVEEVMERLRIGRSTAFDLIGTRRLRSIKVGRRRLVSEAALVEIIERLDREDADQPPSPPHSGETEDWRRLRHAR